MLTIAIKKTLRFGLFYFATTCPYLFFGHIKGYNTMPFME